MTQDVTGSQVARFDDSAPLDMAAFECKSVDRRGVVVVFVPSSRRYVFEWRQGCLALNDPVISGGCAPHNPAVIDCLARAIAFKAASRTSLGKASATGVDLRFGRMQWRHLLGTLPRAAAIARRLRKGNTA